LDIERVKNDFFTRQVSFISSLKMIGLEKIKITKAEEDAKDEECYKMELYSRMLSITTIVNGNPINQKSYSSDLDMPGLQQFLNDSSKSDKFTNFIEYIVEHFDNNIRFLYGEVDTYDYDSYMELWFLNNARPLKIIKQDDTHYNDKIKKLTNVMFIPVASFKPREPIKLYYDYWASQMHSSP